MKDQSYRPTRFSPTRASSLGVIVLFAAVLTFAGVFFVWQRYQFIRLGFEVSSLQKRIIHLEQEIEPLEIEAGYLSRLERIETLARKTLGMRPPRNSQIILMERHDPTSLPPQ